MVRVFLLLAAGLLPLEASVVQSQPVARSSRVPTGLVTSGPPDRPVIALTFEDGPSPYTARFIELLKRNYVTATFFVRGGKVYAYPMTVAEAERAGDQIGNGAFSDRDLETFSTPHVVANLVRTQTSVRQATGIVPSWFRPPFADVDPRITGIAATLGLRTVTWSLDAGDGPRASVSSIESNVLNNVQRGSIILMRDAGRGRLRALQALAYLVHRLKHDGYRFATLDQLFGLKALPPCVPNEAARFAAAGIKPLKATVFYQTWLNLLCRGTDLGPATSPPHRIKHKIEVQDFARTAHQIQLSLRNGRVSIVIVAGWATKVFMIHHIKPKVGQPISTSWYRHFFNGVDWGPALKQPTRHGPYTIQPFLHAWAIEAPDGMVTWHKHLDLKHL